VEVTESPSVDGLAYRMQYLRPHNWSFGRCGHLARRSAFIRPEHREPTAPAESKRSDMVSAASQYDWNRHDCAASIR
jgi:hypothetical protein